MFFNDFLSKGDNTMCPWASFIIYQKVGLGEFSSLVVWLIFVVMTSGIFFVAEESWKKINSEK